MPQSIRTEMVEFPKGDAPLTGFLAVPEGEGPFPGVIVVQEWWGLDDHIKDVTQRFAREGFIALAPDLYRGRTTKEPDEAQKLMMALDMNRASQELTSAADYLVSQPLVDGRGVGAIGFCMGGGLALTLACESAHIRAAAPFYGVNPDPIEKVQNLRGPVLAIYAENDGWVTHDVRERLRAALERHGKRFEVHVYPGTEHAFFNDTRPGIYDGSAATDAWERALGLFRENL